MSRVYISPSTQESNIGLSPFTNEEKQMNGIADKLIPLLLSDGRFFVARNSPDMNVYQCAEDSNNFHADIHIAIHSNAGGGVGTEVYAYAPKTDSERLAKLLYDQIAPLSPGADRGIKYNPGLVEVGDSVAATSCLIELAFHDNQTDATWLAYNHEIIAERLYKGICDYYGNEYRLSSTPKPPTPVVPPPVTTGTSILGLDTVTVEQCNQYIRKVNPSSPDVVPYYKKYGEILGIRWGYAVAQAIKETGFFRYTGDVKPEQNNYAGIGATGGVAGASFRSIEEGVVAHLQHLFAYASTGSLPMPQIDPRFGLVKRGSCPTWESLNGHWASPGAGYGEDICRIYNEIAKEKVENSQLVSLLEQALRIAKG